MNEISRVDGGNNVSALIATIERVATNESVDVEKMNALLDMQERILTRNAMVAFNAAMAEMQSDIPVIAKGGAIVVNGQERSKYAKFDDIMRVIKPVLQHHGFAVSFRTESGEGFIRVTGILMHREGHREETSMALPLDNSGSKNTVQAIGSSTSYAKRYVICALLNIATGDEDDDAQGLGDLDELSETIENIEAADTMPALQATFSAAWNAFPAQSDRTRLTAAKDKRKKELAE